MIDRTLSGQAAAVAARQISPVELVESVLAAIERTQAATNAFTHIFAGEALAQAEALTKTTENTGPLHGVPVAVKELYDVAGAPTTGCCAAYANRLALEDSAVVQRLRAAGAIIVAKTNQHELAIGGSGLESSFGPVGNPWDAQCVPGGSSSGSGAAVAAGAVALAMSSDTAGSIRLPSSFCGVTGLKTGLGVASRRGAMPLAPSLDTMGPIAATAADCELVLRIIARYDAADPWSRPTVFDPSATRAGVAEMRIGIPRKFFSMIDAETRAAVESAAKTFEDLGAAIEEFDGPDPETARRALGAIFVTEFADQYRDLWADDRLGAGAAALLAIGRTWSGPDLASAHALAAVVRHEFDLAFDRYDALLAPSTPHPAPRIDATEVAVDGGVLPNSDVEYSRLAMPVNVAGVPALAFPVGFSSQGMPIGAQLIGPMRSAPMLCFLGAEFQTATDWHARRPPGF